MNDGTKTVKTNIGTIPMEDYLEICATQHGFSSYEDMLKHGYYIEVPDNPS